MVSNVTSSNIVQQCHQLLYLTSLTVAILALYTVLMIENELLLSNQFSSDKSEENFHLKKTIKIIISLLIIIIASFLLSFLYQQNKIKNLERELDTLDIKNTSLIKNDSTPAVEKAIDYKNIEGDTQQITITTMVSSDPAYSSPSTFDIAFKKPTNNSQYTVVGSDIVKTLVISENSYKLEIGFPWDGGTSPFDSVPPIKIIKTNQFGELTRVENPDKYMSGSFLENAGLNKYVYSSYYQINCDYIEPTPPACDLQQVLSETKEPFYMYITCEENEAGGNEKCDEIVKTLSVQKITN
jgi:hypothetical protein